VDQHRTHRFFLAKRGDEVVDQVERTVGLEAPAFSAWLVQLFTHGLEIGELLFGFDGEERHQRP
jgi:hypothetical protein